MSPWNFARPIELQLWRWAVWSNTQVWLPVGWKGAKAPPLPPSCHTGRRLQVTRTRVYLPSIVKPSASDAPFTRSPVGSAEVVITEAASWIGTSRLVVTLHLPCITCIVPQSSVWGADSFVDEPSEKYATLFGIAAINMSAIID